jgi:integrase
MTRSKKSVYLLPFAKAYFRAPGHGPQKVRQLRLVVEQLPAILGVPAPLIQDAITRYGEIQAWVESNRSQISAARILAAFRELLRECERQGFCELPHELRRSHAMPLPIAQPEAAGQFLLTDARDQYFALKELAERTIEGYAVAIRTFERWAGEALTLAAACARLNEFIAWLPSRYSPHSAKTYRRAILVILKSAERDALCVLPKRIRTVSVPELNPRGFTASELAALMEAANPHQKALISLAFDTGLRHCDLERLCWADVDEDSLTVRLIQQKTRRVHTAPITAETIALCRAVQAPASRGDTRLVPLSHHRREFFRQWRKLGDRAEVDLKGRALQAVRRTAATLIAREHGEYAAANFLGHAKSSGVVVFAKHYSVSNVLPQRPPAPSRGFGMGTRELATAAAGS